MGGFLRNKGYPGDPAFQVDAHIGTSYDVVRTVYDNLSMLGVLAALAGAGELDGLLTETDIDSLANLNALVLDSDLATAIQGALADTAVQTASINSLANLNTFLGELLATEGYVTGAIAAAVSALFE